jgi:hypothetical protein
MGQTTTKQSLDIIKMHIDSKYGSISHNQQFSSSSTDTHVKCNKKQPVDDIKQSECMACIVVEWFIENDIWVHKGNGNYSNEQIEKVRQDFVIDKTTLKQTSKEVVLLDTKLSNKKLDNFLLNRYDWIKKILPASIVLEYEPDLYLSTDPDKPYASFSFSRGDWVYNSDCTTLHKEHTKVLNNTNVVLIQNPKNILRIQTLEELCKFNVKYAQYSDPFLTSLLLKMHALEDKPEIEYFTEKHLPIINQVMDKIQWYNTTTIESIESAHPGWIECLKKNQEYDANLIVDSIKLIRLKKAVSVLQSNKAGSELSINWDRIKKDNYYGIAFDFSNVLDLGATEDEQCGKYIWYDCYNSTNLIVWDHRAFSNSVYPVCLKIG